MPHPRLLEFRWLCPRWITNKMGQRLFSDPYVYMPTCRFALARLECWRHFGGFDGRCACRVDCELKTCAPRTITAGSICLDDPRIGCAVGQREARCVVAGRAVAEARTNP